MTDTINWLVSWFEKNQPSVKNLLEQKDIIDKNYFELKLIDSMGIILLIEEIENFFSISLSQTHFEQRKFSTISGLSEIIELERQKNVSL